MFLQKLIVSRRMLHCDRPFNLTVWNLEDPSLKERARHAGNESEHFRLGILDVKGV